MMLLAYGDETGVDPIELWRRAGEHAFASGRDA
jgi:hypothetical protein